MTNSSSRIQVLERLLGLEKKRAEAQAAVDKATAALNQLNAEIASLESGVSAAVLAPAGAKSDTAPARPAVVTKAPEKRKSRGDLKQAVLDVLSKAGPKGIRVAEIAAAIGSKPTNIFTWFNSTGKNVAGLKKIRRGVYAFSGASASAKPAAVAPAKPAAAASVKPAAKVSAKSKSNAKPASKPALAPAVKPAAKPTAMAPAALASGKRRPRGSLTEGILKHLKSAGPKGIPIKVIASNLKTHPRNVSIWLATTGKQYKGITKLSKGVYSMKP